MKGRWAQGLEPRYFTWVITGRLAASERPGGFARNHRKVRRQEELLWLAGHGFTHVLSLLDSPHNLHAYEEAALAYEHVPLGRHDELAERLRDVYTTLSGWLDNPSERVLMHHEESPRVPQPAKQEAATATPATARSKTKGAKPETAGKAKKAASVRGKKAKA